MTAQRGLTVNLPHAATARDEIKQVVTLTVTKEGKLFFDKEEVASPAEAALRLASQTGADAQVSVVINADRAVEHGRVVDLMDAVRQAGVTRIAIAVRPLSRRIGATRGNTGEERLSPFSAPGVPPIEWKAAPAQKSVSRWDQWRGVRPAVRQASWGGMKSCHFDPTFMS